MTNFRNPAYQQTRHATAKKFPKCMNAEKNNPKKKHRIIETLYITNQRRRNVL